MCALDLIYIALCLFAYMDFMCFVLYWYYECTGHFTIYAKFNKCDTCRTTFLPFGHQVYRPHLFTLTPETWMSEQHNKNRYFSNTYSVKSILFTWNCYVLYTIFAVRFIYKALKLITLKLFILSNRLNYTSLDW